MKLRTVIALLITTCLVVSARAQGSSATAATSAGSPQQRSRVVIHGQLQPPPGPGAAQNYLQNMTDVLQTMTQELGQIAQAAHDGKITRQQSDYLSVERYYAAMMRLQLLRAMYHDDDEVSRGASGVQPGASPVADTAVVVGPPASSSDVSEQLAEYLGLSPVQMAAIQAQIDEARKQVTPILIQLDDSRRALTSVTLGGHFDSAQVQTLAAEQSRILLQLIVANTELETKIYRMLTADQQQKLDQLRRQAAASVKASFPGL